jgi:hypothetical protein
VTYIPLGFWSKRGQCHHECLEMPLLGLRVCEFVILTSGTKWPSIEFAPIGNLVLTAIDERPGLPTPWCYQTC